MSQLQWAFWESPGGNLGFAVTALDTPGCVVRHQNLKHALRLAAIAWDAHHEDAENPRQTLGDHYDA